MKRILLILLMLFGSINTLETDNIDVLKQIFPNNDFNINGACKPTCRAVNTGYKTQVTGFNPLVELEINLKK